MITFFQWLRLQHPEYGAVAVHIKNEGARTQGQAYWQRAEGMVKGAADIIIPCSPPFVCEMKAGNGKPTKEQIDYLESAEKLGAFVCVAYGFDGAKEAFEDYLKI